MKLTEFSIVGHAVLQDIRVQVRDHLVVIGANDVGKTSILRMLNLLLGASTQQVYQSLTSVDVRDPDTPLIVQARLEDFTEDEAGLFAFAMTVEDDRADYLEVRLEAHIPEDDADGVAISRFFPDAGTRRAVTRDQLQAIGWRYLPANRTSTADYMNGRTGPFRTMLDSVDVGDELSDLGSLLNDFNDKLEANSALQELRQQIAAHLSRSIPRSYTEDSLAIRTAADPAQEPLQDVTMFLKEGERLLSLADQSDGMRQLMSLTFFDLAQAAANIVAVDEPEIHLHPSSQRTVATLFAESPKQRLVVTHSPYVVQRFEPKHVLVIDPDSRARQIDASNFTSVEKEMLHWWSPQLLEGLTAKRILFVEGIADRILVEEAARAMELSLDRLGVSVFVLDGADKFSHVLNIIGSDGFDLSICGLCDEDRKASWANLLKVKPKNMGKIGFFVASSDLEHEYVQAIGAQTVASELISQKMCRKEGLMQAAGIGDLRDLTDGQLGDFLVRDESRKVPAARVVGPMLTRDHIDASPALSGLLAYIQKV